MRPSLAATLSLLLVVTSVAAAPVAPATGDGPAAVPPSTPRASVVQVPNTTAVLTLPADEIQINRFARPGVEVSTAIAADRDGLGHRYLELAFQTAFYDTDNQSTRTRLIRSTAAAVENRTAALRERQRAALHQYNTGSISTDAFLYELARIDAEARRLSTLVNRLRTDVAATVGFAMSGELRTRLDNLRADLVALQGPVRDRLVEVVRGSAEPTAVYVETSADGVVLATVDDTTFVREAYVAGARRPSEPDQFAQSDQPRISAAYQRAAELYPWAFENAISPPSAGGFGNTSAFHIRVDHRQGELTSYVDGSTTDAFREFQHLRVGRLPTVPGAANETERLRLQVNVTYQGGPMQVRLSRPEMPATVDANITVDGQPVGRTEADGELWTVDTRGVTRVNATTPGGDRITVQVVPPEQQAEG